MTPAVRPGMLVYPEAERVGRGIGAAAVDLHTRLESSLTGRVRHTVFRGEPVVVDAEARR